MQRRRGPQVVGSEQALGAPLKSVTEYVAARARPGELDFAHSTRGTHGNVCNTYGYGSMDFDCSFAAPCTKVCMPEDYTFITDVS